MRRQDQHVMNKQDFTGDDNENRDIGKIKAHNPGSEHVSHADVLYNTPSTSTDFAAPSPTPIFTFNTPAPVTEPARNPFAFQQRARESSAASQVSSRITSNRDSRKAGFIDRLRRSRRDERDARGLDSFEKAEYWRERRDRETRLWREAAGYDIVTEEDPPDVEAYEDEDAELSPVDDEREVAELVDAYYNDNRHLEHHVDDELMSDDFGIDDEEDYAEAFLEVLSQQQMGMGHASTMQSTGATTSGDDMAPDVVVSSDQDGGDMDVS